MRKSVKFRSYAKINIGLTVSPVRADGYHNIETLFQTINLSDVIELEIPTSDITVKCSDEGLPVDERNLAVRAALKFIERSDLNCGFTMNIDKNIPYGAGLGGGSSNAGSVLLALNRMISQPLKHEDLQEIAQSLGADVPFFLQGGLMYAQGIGEKLNPFPEFEMDNILLICPYIKSYTKEVYDRYDLLLTERKNNIKMNRFYDRPVHGYDHYSDLVNDLEPGVVDSSSELSEIKKVLDSTRPVFSMMSGSGSSFYAVYKSSDLRSAALKMTGRLDKAESYCCRTVGKEEYIGNFAF